MNGYWWIVKVLGNPDCDFVFSLGPTDPDYDFSENWIQIMIILKVGSGSGLWFYLKLDPDPDCDFSENWTRIVIFLKAESGSGSIGVFLKAGSGSGLWFFWKLLPDPEYDYFEIIILGILW